MGEGVVEEYETKKEPKPQTTEIIEEDVQEEPEKEEEQKPTTQNKTSKPDFSDEQIKERVRHEDERKALIEEIEQLKQQLEQKNKQIKETEKEQKKTATRTEKLEKELNKKDEKIRDMKNKTRKPFNAWKYLSLILIAAVLLLLFAKISAEPTNNQEKNESIQQNETTTNPIPNCITKDNQTTCELTITTKEPELTILNDKNCKTCETNTTLQLIKQLFPEIKTINADYNTAEGKKLYTEYNIKYLPAYIFSQEINQTQSWKTNERLRTSFIQEKDKYLLKAESTNSSYEPK